MTTHDLKTWPEHFQSIKRREKTFEIRKDDDRGYRAGDFLRLKEFDPVTETYSGDEITVLVPYLLAGGIFGLQPGYVCMSIEPIHQ